MVTGPCCGGGSMWDKRRWPLVGVMTEVEAASVAMSMVSHHAWRWDGGFVRSVSRLVSNKCRSTYESISGSVDVYYSVTSTFKSRSMRLWVVAVSIAWTFLLREFQRGCINWVHILYIIKERRDWWSRMLFRWCKWSWRYVDMFWWVRPIMKWFQPNSIYNCKHDNSDVTPRRIWSRNQQSVIRCISSCKRGGKFTYVIHSFISEKDRSASCRWAGLGQHMIWILFSISALHSEQVESSQYSLRARHWAVPINPLENFDIHFAVEGLHRDIANDVQCNNILFYL